MHPQMITKSQSKHFGGQGRKGFHILWMATKWSALEVVEKKIIPG